MLLKLTLGLYSLDEWSNFNERVDDPKLGYVTKDRKELIRHWVSYRAQTLSRTGLPEYLQLSYFSGKFCYALYSSYTALFVTVRGMMYYRQALDLQCFLEYADDKGVK